MTSGWKCKGTEYWDKWVFSSSVFYNCSICLDSLLVHNACDSHPFSPENQCAKLGCTIQNMDPTVYFLQTFKTYVERMYWMGVSEQEGVVHGRQYVIISNSGKHKLLLSVMLIDSVSSL